MLIYNYQKEFLGIDEKDLSALGFSNLAQLQEESADFADLFVKTPGFIHNFKHVHWIDFITCADSSEDSKVIIHAKNKNYRCTLDIQTLFLADNPSQKAYSVNLQNIRELSSSENDKIASDLAHRIPPKAAVLQSAIEEEHFVEDAQEEAHTPENVAANIQDPYESHVDLDEKIELDEFHEQPLVVDEYEPAAEENLIQEDTQTQEDSIELEDDVSFLDEVEIEDEPEIVNEPEFQVHKEEEIQDDDFDNSYEFDPTIAASDLGLPQELIEEFVQDFIAQAKEFKEELYENLENGKLDDVKILSHKLKGVAANLRIENAFEVLVIINTSEVYDEIKLNLNRLYKIVAKLAGEDFEEVASKPITPIEQEDETQEELPQAQEESSLEAEDDALDIDDLYSASEEFDLEDAEVPSKIDILELADDEFLSMEESSQSSDEELAKEISIIEDLDEFEDIELENTDDLDLKLELEEEIEDELSLEEELSEDEKLALENPVFVEDPTSLDEKEDEFDLKDDEFDLKDDEFDLKIDDELEIDKELDNSVEENFDQELFTQESTDKTQEVPYSKEKVATEIGISEENFNELYEDFLIESKISAETIESAIKHEDSATWRHSAIKLKGMCDNMRVNTIRDELDTIISTQEVEVAQNMVEKIITKLASMPTSEV